MSSDCIFCKIANGEIPAEKVLETEDVVVFKDIKPVTPVHCLAIPRAHIGSMNEASQGDAEVLGKTLLAAAAAAEKLGVAKSGYRLTVNTNRDAGQEVFHIHVHLMGGRGFRWPPG